jgi:hypothetical protein
MDDEKAFEKLARDAAAHWEAAVVVEGFPLFEPEEPLIVWVYREQAECILEVG